MGNNLKFVIILLWVGHISKRDKNTIPMIAGKILLKDFKSSSFSPKVRMFLENMIDYGILKKSGLVKKKGRFCNTYYLDRKACWNHLKTFPESKMVVLAMRKYEKNWLKEKNDFLSKFFNPV